MIVDAHAHCWGRGFMPRAFHKHTAEIWASKSPGRTVDMILPRIEDGLIDVDGKMFVDNMDRAGIDVTLLMMADFGMLWTGEEPAVALEEQASYYAELQKRHSGRLYAFAWADPRRANGIEIMEKAIAQYGFKGCGEFTTKDLCVNDEAVRPVVDMCVRLNVPVLLHTRAGEGTDIAGTDFSTGNRHHPSQISRLLAQRPDLKVIMAHAGYPRWWRAAALTARGHPNCFLELSNWNMVVPDLTDFVPILGYLRDIVGADHILFGSDQQSGGRFCGANSFLPAWVDFFKRLPTTARDYGCEFTKQEVDLILGENAKKLFDL